MNWKRPAPLWILLIAMLATASATAGVILLPSILSPKPDFIMSGLHPMYVQANGANQTLITIQATRNFTGIVTVTTDSPPGVGTLLLDPQTWTAKDQVLLGKAGTLSLNVKDGEVGNFTVTVTASSGAISHTASFPVIVQNLTMTSSQSSLMIMRGSSGTTEIDLSSVNGLSGNLSLGTTVYSGYPPDYASSASVSPTNMILSSGGAGKITLTISVGQSDTSSLLRVLVSASMVRQLWTFNLNVQVSVV